MVVAPARGQPDGPEVDKNLAATAWTCGWLAGEHKRPETLREPLRKLATSGLAKLP